MKRQIKRTKDEPVMTAIRKNNLKICKVKKGENKTRIHKGMRSRQTEVKQTIRQLTIYTHG